MEYLQYLRGAKLNRLSSFVLNLIINGIPSIQCKHRGIVHCSSVLNLIINGIPSIRALTSGSFEDSLEF